jgi:D-Tyr-tRNAtyr deacylase
MKIRKVAASAMNPKTEVATSRQPSARDLQRIEIEQQIIGRLTDESIVLAIDPEEGEKPATLRQRILRVASDKHVEIAIQVKQDGEGQRLLVGLMTPERRSRRGRRPKAS